MHYFYLFRISPVKTVELNNFSINNPISPTYRVNISSSAALYILVIF